MQQLAVARGLAALWLAAFSAGVGGPAPARPHINPPGGGEGAAGGGSAASPERST